KDLKAVMTTVLILSFRSTPVGASPYKTKELTEKVSLKDAGAPLSAAQLAAIKVEDPVAARKARAAIWFANDSGRLRSAMLLDLIELGDQLHPYLDDFLKK